MTSIANFLSRIEKQIATAKFAVIIILIYAAYMAVGTFFESYYGTEYAGRAIYKNWPFMLIQFLMLLSIFYALMHRLPAKKRLYGFYTIHAGLIILFCGSFITYYAGVDGSITLKQGAPSQIVTLNRDMLYITDHDNDTEITYLLPYSHEETTINDSYKQITLKRYLPFSDETLRWPIDDNPKYSNRSIHSSQYFLYNDNVSQEITMSLHPEALDFQPSQQLGPLNIHYLPAGIAECFATENPSKLLIWDSETQSCFTPEEKGISIQTAKTGKDFLVLPGKNGVPYSFFPDFSPWPLEFKNEKLEPIKDASMRIFSRKIFQDKPHLFLFGKKLSFYSEDSGKWVVKSVVKDVPVELPWMDFKINILDHHEKALPTLEPHFQKPIQVNNKVIQGDVRALEIEVQGRTYWVKKQKPIALMIDGKKYSFYLGVQSLRLPFELNLTRFKMDTDPGTRSPASYESFVNLFSSDGVQKHHIFMNNPLKYENFTFYQASYFQDEAGNYGSVLSVNFDPGRFWKYLGSLLLVLGSVWHFYLRRKVVIKKTGVTV